MKEFRVTIFMQIGVVSLLVMVTLAVIISAIIGTILSQCLASLTELETAMMTGIPIADDEAYSITSIRRNLSNLRWITYWTVGSALAVLCAGVFTMIWIAERTVSRQTREIQLREGELSALNNLIQRQQPFPPLAILEEFLWTPAETIRQGAKQMNLRPSGLVLPTYPTR